MFSYHPSPLNVYALWQTSKKKFWLLLIEGEFLNSYIINVSLQHQVYVKGYIYFLFVLFVWLEFFVPLEIFKLIWRRLHCRWKAANFDLCSALMAIKQWGHFSVPQLLWHVTSVYNGHLRGPITLTPNAKCWEVELSLPVFITKVCRGWDVNTQPSPCEANALNYGATAAVAIRILIILRLSWHVSNWVKHNNNITIWTIWRV